MATASVEAKDSRSLCAHPLAHRVLVTAHVFFEHDPLLLAVAESKDPETELLVLCWVGEWLERVPSLLQT